MRHDVRDSKTPFWSPADRFRFAPKLASPLANSAPRATSQLAFATAQKTGRRHFHHSMPASAKASKIAI
jgi:hypothetical protein